MDLFETTIYEQGPTLKNNTWHTGCVCVSINKWLIMLVVAKCLALARFSSLHSKFHVRWNSYRISWFAPKCHYHWLCVVLLSSVYVESIWLACGIFFDMSTLQWHLLPWKWIRNTMPTKAMCCFLFYPTLFAFAAVVLLPLRFCYICYLYSFDFSFVFIKVLYFCQSCSYSLNL